MLLLPSLIIAAPTPTPMEHSASKRRSSLASKASNDQLDNRYELLYGATKAVVKEQIIDELESRISLINKCVLEKKRLRKGIQKEIVDASSQCFNEEQLVRPFPLTFPGLYMAIYEVFHMGQDRWKKMKTPIPKSQYNPERDIQIIIRTMEDNVKAIFIHLESSLEHFKDHLKEFKYVIHGRWTPANFLIRVDDNKRKEAFNDELEAISEALRSFPDVLERPKVPNINTKYVNSIKLCLKNPDSVVNLYNCLMRMKNGLEEQMEAEKKIRQAQKNEIIKQLVSIYSTLLPGFLHLNPPST